MQRRQLLPYSKRDVAVLILPGRAGTKHRKAEERKRTRRYSLAGTLAQTGQVKDDHGACFQANPAAGNKLSQSLVHGLTGCANQLCQLFLSQLVGHEYAVGCGRPKRSARSSRALARRPGTSEKTRSASASLAWRRRRAKVLMTWSEIEGSSC